VGGSVTVGFNVLDENGEDVKAPSCADAAQFVKRPFASLPVDQDCNGIADDWENNHGGPFPDPTADADPGALGSATPDTYKGDGFAVFDEYRGFHMLNDQGNTVWHDTDPNVQDLFYWDPNKLMANPIDKKNPQSGNHLANIFGAQTGGFMRLHRLNGKQAHATDPNDGTQPLNPVNSNSPFLDAGGPQGFAVSYVEDDTLPAGTLGDSGLDSDPNSLRNAGQQPIRIDLEQIKQKANAVWAGNSAAYASTLLDQVSAHETGHRLGRMHRRRVPAKVPFDKDGIRTLALGQFTQNPALKHLDKLFVAESIYALTTQAGFQQNVIRNDENIVSMVPSSVTSWPGEPVGQPKPPVWPYEHKLQQKLVIDSVTLESQDGTIMCWTPKLDQTQDSQWTFAPDDLNALCLNAEGCDSTK